MRRSVDDINRANWRDPAVVADFARSQGWLDAGEQAVLLHVADSARGLPVLDVGVGAGRTTPLLRLLSSDYLGIDYTPEMIVRARRRFPDAAFEVADARDLASLSAGSFALAYFSFNGIDAVDEAGGAAVDDAGRDEDDQFGFVVLKASGAEKRAEDGEVAEEENLVDVGAVVALEQPGEHQGFAGAHVELGVEIGRAHV